MNKDKDGGPAFPGKAWSNFTGGYTESVPGMSMRDYFAGQALAGIITDHSYDHSKPGIIAHRAYAMADAMIQERGR